MPTHAPALAAELPEATRFLDSIDRWKIAEKFSLNRVHDFTRVQLYKTFEQTGRWNFAAVMQAISRFAEKEFPSDMLPVINLQDFDADTEAGSPVLNDGSSIEPFFHTMRWLRESVTRVCPYVGPALERHRIWLAAANREDSFGGGLQEYLLKAHHTLEHINIQSEPSDRRLNSLIVTLPDFPPHRSPVRDLEEMRDNSAFTSLNGITGAPFLPSITENNMADPQRKTPPVFAFRNEMKR